MAPWLDFAMAVSARDTYDPIISRMKDRYLKALLNADIEAARRVVDDALAHRVNARTVYLHVLMPAQAALGELWTNGQISVADEHVATNITLSEMARLRQMITPKPSLGKRAVITSVTGDSHMVGGRAVADFLQLDGWQVDLLGENMPAEEIRCYLERRGCDVLGVSITLPEVLPEVKRTVALLRALPECPRIIVGGPAAATLSDTAQDLGVDAIVRSAAEAVATARKLAGVSGTCCLQQFLVALGKRIQSYRRAQRLSQQQLAESSGLDRAYISAVEHGKHNVTLGAVAKLAEALDLPIEELLVGDPEFGA